MEKEQESPEINVALIVGATGMAGLSLAEALPEPNALGGPWRIYGAARRPKPTWFPSKTTDLYLTFDATNFDETQQKLSPIAHEVTHVFWVAIQVRENEEANIKVNTTMLANVLNVLRSAASSRLAHVTLQAGLDPQPRRPYFSAHNARPAVPRRSAPILSSKLLLRADLVKYHAPAVSYSVHRASIIIGASSRSLYNFLLMFAVYAAICRHEGIPFRYPGSKYTWEHFCDMSDARVPAQQHIWAATTSKAKNEAFDCSNGDVFTWKSVWKLLSELFDVEFVALEDLVGMKEKLGKVWDEIVENNGLCKTKLEERTNFESMNMVVLNFSFQHVWVSWTHMDTLKSIPMKIMSSVFFSKKMSHHRELSTFKSQPIDDRINSTFFIIMIQLF